MADLELRSNPTFTPIPLDAPDPLPHSDLIRRVNAALTKEYEAQRSLKYSDNHRMWDRHVYKSSLRDARRKAIAAWNAEQLAKAAAALPASE